MSVNAIKNYIEQNFPSSYYALRYLKKQGWRFRSMEDTFTRIYRNKIWSSESVSGVGSILSHTKVIRRELPGLLDEIGATSLLDIPCGDFNWLKEVSLNLGVYIGADVVEELIIINNKNFGNDARKFVKLDITKDELPLVDVIFCRDCLVHFSFDDIFLALKNIKASNSKYLLTTTFTARDKNKDIFSGEWRPLNLQHAPFRFPKPIEIINENCPENGYADKSLGLWRILDIVL